MRLSDRDCTCAVQGGSECADVSTDLSFLIKMAALLDYNNKNK